MNASILSKEQIISLLESGNYKLWCETCLKTVGIGEHEAEMLGMRDQWHHRVVVRLKPEAPDKG